MHLLRPAAISLVLCAPLLAQQPAHHHDMSAPAISETARQQITSVETAIRPLASTRAADSAGFHPLLGWIPTMGEHWVNRGLMQRGARFDMTAPSQLMFSRIAGKDSLVGAAYAYNAPAGDTARPSTFDGAPAWHEHANLAPAGQTLVMLHVWFVPSPDGPFAGTNPNLPFWALGLATPDSARMHDPAYANRARRAALGLAELVDTAGIFPTLNARPAVRARLAPRRDSLRDVAAELRAAGMAHDAARQERGLSRAAELWDAMYADYLGSTITMAGRTRVVTYESMLLGEHEH